MSALSLLSAEQDPSAIPTTHATQDTQAVSAPPEKWTFDSSFFYSDPPGSDARTTAILYADRGRLHLEGRYGYEDKDTGSLFAGWRFNGGDDVKYTLTPMIGAVVGHTDGFAPGLEADLGWRKLNFYTEAEYLFDTHDSDDDFFYSWSTLMYSFNDWLSAGIAAERSRQVDTGLSIQRGLVLQVVRERFSFALYEYNIGTDDNYTVVSFGVGI
jgi:hypothetical protein